MRYGDADADGSFCGGMVLGGFTVDEGAASICEFVQSVISSRGQYNVRAEFSKAARKWTGFICQSDQGGIVDLEMQRHLLQLNDFLAEDWRCFGVDETACAE